MDRKLLGRLIALTLLSGLTACSAGTTAGAHRPDASAPVPRADETTFEFTGDTVLSPDVVVPERDTVGARLIAVEVQDDRLIFIYDTDPSAGVPQPGNVVAGDLGGGYMRRVTETRPLGSGRYELLTASATLTDIFEELHFSMEFRPGTDGATIPIEDVGGGVGGARAALGDEASVDLTPRVKIAEGFTCGTSTGNVTATPTLNFQPIVKVRINIEKRFWIFPRLVSAHFELGGSVTAGLDLEGSAAAGVMCSWSAPLDRFGARWTTIVPTPAGVPIVLKHELGPDLSVGASWTGAQVSGTVHASGTLELVLGTDKADVDAEWTDISHATARGEFTVPPTEDVAWSAAVHVEGGVKYSLRVYDAVGPDMSLSVPVDGTYSQDASGCGTYDLQAGLNATVGVEIQIPVLDTTIASTSFTRPIIPQQSILGFPRNDTGCAMDAGVDSGTPPDPCTALTDCASCNERPGCGFCQGTGCQSDSQRSACGAAWQDSPSACVGCDSYTDCRSCASDGFCGWCPGTGCLNDSAGGRDICGTGYVAVPWVCAP